ncbi:MAG: diguanylate cyclase, partial [Chloroflexi bacterium]|nr:diguanylate cyclase [Chloroflexota bacterium]
IGVASYEPVRDEYSVRRLALMHDLRRCIRDDELSLHYQPKVALATGKVCGVEALLRWFHPVHGYIPPAEFVLLAEQTGMIVSLTEWVLLTALRQAREWQDAGQPIPIAINLSTRSLQDQRFPDLVARHIQRYGVSPAALVLEITETSLMTDPTRARETLKVLHGLGVRVAIDDFGTGYSSLGYLKELPVDEVKIDKSFVQGMGTGDQKDAAIVRSVIALAQALGMEVVAEGVEDASTFGLLRDLGCDIAQGYYVSRPQPVSELEQWLQDHRVVPSGSSGFRDAV